MGEGDLGDGGWLMSGESGRVRVGCCEGGRVSGTVEVGSWEGAGLLMVYGIVEGNVEGESGGVLVGVSVVVRALVVWLDGEQGVA